MENDILGIQLKRLGDLILTAPAFDAIRAHRPGARLTVVIDSAAAALRPLFPAVDEFLVYQKGTPNFSLWRRLFLSKPDACLDFSGTDRSALMTRLTRAPRRITSEKLGANSPGKRRAYHHLVDASVRDLHTIEYHQRFLGPLGIEPPAPPLRLEIPGPTREAVDRLLTKHDLAGRPFALLHPGSARADKFWQPQGWAAVAARLAAAPMELPCVLTGGPGADEQEHITEILAAARTPVIDLSKETDLLQLAELTRRTTFAVTVDTLALHLAAAFQTPQMALFGPTNPFHWRPLHDRATIMLAGAPEPLTHFTPRHPAAPMSALEPADVIRTLEDQWR